MQGKVTSPVTSGWATQTHTRVCTYTHVCTPFPPCPPPPPPGTGFAGISPPSRARVEEARLCVCQAANGGRPGPRRLPLLRALYGEEGAVNNASVELSCVGAK